MLALWKERQDKSRQHIKKQRHHFADSVFFTTWEAHLYVCVYMYKYIYRERDRSSILLSFLIKSLICIGANLFYYYASVFFLTNCSFTFHKMCLMLMPQPSQCFCVFSFLVLHLDFYSMSLDLLQVSIIGEGNVSQEKAMAPHSSTLAWKIPWTEEPGRLQSMGSRRVRQD